MPVDINLNTSIIRAISISLKIQEDVENLNVKMLDIATLNIETYNDTNLIR